MAEVNDEILRRREVLAEHYKDILNFYNKHLLNQPMQKSKSLERTPWSY